MTAPLDLAADATDWDRALSAVRHLHGDAFDRELTFARSWADSVTVDYDDGPCAIGFVKGDSTYWFLIDDNGCEWDADDPRGEFVESLLARLSTAEQECERLRGRLESSLDTSERVDREREAAVVERDAAIRERDEEREHHKRLSAESHKAAMQTCTSLASQVETLAARLATVEQERDQNLEELRMGGNVQAEYRNERDAYRAMVCDLLASAHPNAKEHPAMTKQWARARELLKHGPTTLTDTGKEQ